MTLLATRRTEGAALFGRTQRDETGAPLINGDTMAGTIYPGEGELLYGLVSALKPNNVLEIGTGYGYSTIHLAAAMRDLGKGLVYTVEPDEGRRKEAVANLAEAGLLPYAEFYPAVPPIRAEFVFIDAYHDRRMVEGYIRQAESCGCQYGAIHDAMSLNHAYLACKDTNWMCMVYPHTSHLGMALIMRYQYLAEGGPTE